MKKILVAAALLVGTMVSAQAANLSKTDCEAIWNDARPKGSDMSAELAKPYVDDFKAVDTNGDNHISSNEFLAGCDKGLVHAGQQPSTGTDKAPKQ
jgi:hypothetical protein